VLNATVVKLNLNRCKKIGDPSLLEIAKSKDAHQLEELKLNWVRHISDNGLTKVAESCTNLQVLSLQNVGGITNWSSFLRKMSSLSSLDIEGPRPLTFSK
jgi:hypothetical protein